MLRTTVGGSSSKSDLEDNLNHEESYPLSEDKEALKDFQKMGGC